MVLSIIQVEPRDGTIPPYGRQDVIVRFVPRLAPRLSGFKGEGCEQEPLPFAFEGNFQRRWGFRAVIVTQPFCSSQTQHEVSPIGTERSFHSYGIIGRLKAIRLMGRLSLTELSRTIVHDVEPRHIVQAKPAVISGHVCGSDLFTSVEYMG